jgi:hypothetical protein
MKARARAMRTRAAHRGAQARMRFRAMRTLLSMAEISERQSVMKMWRRENQ